MRKKKNDKPKYLISFIATFIALAAILLFYFVYRTVPTSTPNVFLQFQLTSANYYKILINDSLIIDSDRIEKMKYSNEHYKTKTLNLKLVKGNYNIQIKDSKEMILSNTILKIDNLKPKYIYLRKEIVITDKPFILI